MDTSDLSAIIDSDFTAMNSYRQSRDNNNAPVDDVTRTKDDCRQHVVNGRYWLLTFLCVAAVGQSMSVNGLIGVTISTIEKRFALSSSQTAWITSAYEVAGVPVLLVVGYVGFRLRRPFWIAGGLVLLVFAIFIYMMPHFVAPLYSYDSNNASNGKLCVGGFSNDSSPQCSSGSINRNNDQNDYLAMFIVSAVLMGIGSVPLFVLGVTYIDDLATDHSSAFYLGQYLAILSLSLFQYHARLLVIYYFNRDRGQKRGQN